MVPGNRKLSASRRSPSWLQLYRYVLQGIDIEVSAFQSAEVEVFAADGSHSLQWFAWVTGEVRVLVDVWWSRDANSSPCR